MKRMILFILFLPVSLFSQAITWTETTANYTLPEGIKIFHGERASPKLNINYIDVDMNNSELVIHPYITNTNKTVKDFVPFVGAYAGVNGGFFGGTNSYSAVVYPFEVKAQNITAVTRNSQSYPLTRSFFGMNIDRTFEVSWIYHFGSSVNEIFTFDSPMPYASNQQTPLPPPDQYTGLQYKNLLVGIGGAPTLVKNGQVNVTYDQEIMWGSGVGYDNRDPRTAVGYTLNNHVIMIIADGRLPAVSEGVGLPELAQIMIDLNCVEAMNLDGGGSSQMAVGNQYVNNPSETRAVPTILTVTHIDSLHLPLNPQFEKIIDTSDPEASMVGEGWFESANPGYWPPTPSQLHQIGTGNSYYQFKPEFPSDTYYELYAWWVAASNRCTNTPFIINHQNGLDTIKVNQTLDGSSWKLIGTYRFSPSMNHNIMISDAGTSGTYVVADAIKLVSYDPSTDLTNRDVDDLPERFELSNNFPNPFNPVTQISYSLPTVMNVQLIIYDVLGNEVKKLVQSEQSAGTYRVQWDGTNDLESKVNSGVYFYTIIAGEYIQTRKMMLLK